MTTARSALALALAGLGAVACEPGSHVEPTRASGRPSGVLLVTLDTTRADRLGPYGHAGARTPRLDALAAEGTTFEQAFTPIPSTFPSHSSLMTAKYPQSHGVHDNAVYTLGPENLTLAEILAAQRWRTAAFVSAFVLDAQFGLDQGFEVYDDAVDRPLMTMDLEHLGKDVSPERRKWQTQLGTAYQRRGDATVAAALSWLGGLGEQPFFLWVHLFDAHQPYQPPPPYDRAFDPDYQGTMDGDQRRFWALRERGELVPADRAHMIALYDGELAWQDECLGRLLDGLRAVGRADETLVVVVADHGEGLGEHRQMFEHNNELYDEVVHVPLLVRRPGGARGERVAALVRTLDVAPTVLEWLGIRPPADMQGRSLLAFTEADPELRARAEVPGEILLEALRGRQILPAPHALVGLRTVSSKVIVTLDGSDQAQSVELFDLTRARGERRDQARTDGDEVARWRDEALSRVRALPQASGDNARELGALDSEALRALGYAGR